MQHVFRRMSAYPEGYVIKGESRKKTETEGCLCIQKDMSSKEKAKQKQRHTRVPWLRSVHSELTTGWGRWQRTHRVRRGPTPLATVAVHLAALGSIGMAPVAPVTAEPLEAFVLVR